MIQKKILFIYPNFSTFVEKDFVSLQKRAEVYKYRFKPEKNLLKFLFEFVKQFVFLAQNILKADFLYCWFSDYHSFLPIVFAKLFRKKSIIIVGGTDAVSIPEYGYGIFYKNNLRSQIAKFIYSNASFILAVNKSLISGKNYFADENGLNTGVEKFVKNIKGQIIEVPTGYDSNKWFLEEFETKENRIITIAGVKELRTFFIKGLPLFIEVARKLESYQFEIIGLSDEIKDSIKPNTPKNLILHDFIENSALRSHIARSKVYCQFSVSEGLPNALCEAMLCECIPVGSNVNGIPDGIGDAGLILMHNDVDEAVKLVEEALKLDWSAGKMARDHIVKNFSQERRENTIFKLLEI